MAESPQTRPSLLQRLRGRRDEPAWAEFLVIYEPLVLRLMRRRGLQESDARDALQQVLLRISGAIERYEPDGAQASFRRWLYCIARNVVVTFLTRQARQPESLGDRQPEDISETQPAATAESDLFDHEYQQQVLAWATEQVRCEFRDPTWRAFVETSIHGRPIAEVARELGLSAGSVYVARSRVIARLRAKVEEFEANT
ncbi:MAG TPA: sigma-70 family RNA polymerase sigma factor [Planctomycetaceae bacterium]